MFHKEFEHSNELLAYTEALRRASELPYNNAAHIFEMAGLAPDPRMGGSCLHKLNMMCKELNSQGLGRELKIIATNGKVTHFAAIITTSGKEYYLDPFLWQTVPLELGKYGDPALTLEKIWQIRQEHSEDSLPTISLIQIQDNTEPKNLISHQFTRVLDAIPARSVIGLHPKLPSFNVQIPSGNVVYKVWYSKAEKKISDIWIVDGNTSVRTRVPNDDVLNEIRMQVIQDIYHRIQMTEAEICAYFAQAHELEMTLSSIIASSDQPYDH